MTAPSTTGCDRTERVAEYAMQALAPAEAVAFRAHIDACPACRAELDLFRRVLGADVTRERHIASGDRCCEYRIAGDGAPRS